MESEKTSPPIASASQVNPLLLKPLSLERAISATFDFATKNITLLFITFAVVKFPLNLISQLLFNPAKLASQTAALQKEIDLLGQNADSEKILAFLQSNVLSTIAPLAGKAAAWGFVAGLLSLLVTIAVQQAIIWLAEGKKPTLAETYQKAASKFIPYILTSIVFGIIFGIGLIFLVIPGICIAIVWGFFPWIVLSEDKMLFEAFSRSKEIASGNVLRILGYSLIFFILMALVGAVIGLILGIVSMIPLIGSLTQTILDALSIVGMIFGAILFYSLQAEKAERGK